MGWTDKVLSKMRPGSEGCWEWLGRKDREGYGVHWVTHVGQRQAHRLSYELHVGPIPDGLTIDHLCRNKGCVNPAHLDPVPIGVNVRRGDTPASRNLAKTHCINGHPFDEANTHTRARGKRECRLCMRDRTRARRAKLRLERAV